MGGLEQTKLHTRHMRRALRLARRGFGRAGPNPQVGAVLVQQGRIVGEGFHIFERRHHAEVLALRQAGSESRGASLYLNLEPCSHHGRTPPCVDEIIRAGIREVFVSVIDPDPRVGGEGVEKLRQAGIRVELGLFAREATRLNEAFLFSVKNHRPFVTLKLAMTLDGRIADREGRSQWITGPEARKAVHRDRYGADAVLVGVGTVMRDNPSLDVRWRRRNAILKVILDSRLRLSPEAKIFNSGDPVILFHSIPAPSADYPPHCETVLVKRDDYGLAWSEILKELGRRGVRSLIVEGGRAVATSALRSEVVEKISFFYGPRILGGRAVAGIADLGINGLEGALQVSDLRLRRFGQSFQVEGYPRPTS